MRIVFFGSAPIAFPSLEALLSSPADEVVAVLTQPDRPAGRHRRLTPCAVKSFALERHLPLLSPGKPGDAAAELTALQADLYVVVAYGQYIPSSILSQPRFGAINLHPSLLPKYRGASPIQWALANGDPVTGVTILYVSKQMDAGDILLQREIPIDPEATALTLEPQLATAGAQLLMDAIGQIRSGAARPVPQDPSGVVTVRKLVKEDGALDWTEPAQRLCNRIRAFIVWPGCFCQIPVDDGEPGLLRVLKAAVEPGEGVPGTVLDVSGGGPLVATGEGALRLLEVQPAGKRAMEAAAWLRGHSLRVGDCLPCGAPPSDGGLA